MTLGCVPTVAILTKQYMSRYGNGRVAQAALHIVCLSHSHMLQQSHSNIDSCTAAASADASADEDTQF
ncbi:hypothetical protein BST61_g798 [Cercospora zeina]